MNNENLVYSHTAYFNILKTRGMQGLQKDMPLWKFKLSEEEYEALKQTLRCHTSDLARYGEEAAFVLCRMVAKRLSGDYSIQRGCCYGDRLA